MIINKTWISKPGKVTLLVIFFFTEISSFSVSRPKSIPELKNIHSTHNNPVFKHWKKMIHINLRQIRKKPYQPLQKIQFARYQIKKGDQLWDILSSMSLDVDTIAQVNQLSSIHDTKPGEWLLIPNMRGTLRAFPKNANINQISQKWGVPIIHIKTANRIPIYYKNKQFLFLPGTKMTQLERGLFYGTAFLSPLRKGTISSRFGPRKDPFTDKRTFHGGLDIAAPAGTQVFAARKGKVIYSGQAGGYGNLIILQHSQGYQTYYGHLSRILVQKGQTIAPGNIIGYVGSTGKSTGPHLHFEIRRKGRFYNPQKYIHSLKHK